MIITQSEFNNVRMGSKQVYRSCTLVLLFVSILFLSACATNPAVLKFESGGVSKLWPEEPETPRYKFVGFLTGENNLVSEDEGSFTRFLKWLVGLAGSPRKAVLQRPQTGFVDEQRQRILVTDISRQAIFVFDAINGELTIWEQAGKESGVNFEAPIGIVPADNGDILVADAELAEIIRLDTDGRPLGSFGRGKLIRPTGLARDPESKLIYVSDTHAHDIKVFNDQGELIDVIGERGEKNGQFNFPTHLAIAKGKLYVTDSMNSRVQVLSLDGQFLNKFGKRSLFLGDMVRPKGITVDSEGNIYVVESYYDFLLVYNKSGNFLLPVGGTGSGIGQFYLPAGVWSDSNDRIYVADMFNGRVVIFQYLGNANPG